MEKLESYIKNIYSSYAHFLFNKKEFYDVVFKEDQHYFRVSNENPDFVERDNSSNIHESLIEDYKFSEEYINKINNGIKTKKTFAFELSLGRKHNVYDRHEHYVIVFIPIHDEKEKRVYTLFFMSLLMS